MTLSMHASSATWDRTLPNPASLTNGIIRLPRRSSSLSVHQINSDKFLAPVIEDLEQRNILPQIAAKSSEQLQLGVRPPFDNGMSDDEDSDSPSTSENPSGYCLCQPERKIPRPRNAFILYRQHQHASVVAQHPGLPNPEISKIIGEQWRSLLAKDKNEWKALAEQEKVRHSELHPNYRYKPKRNLKAGSDAQTPTTVTCPKCGGRTMNPPTTPQFQAFASGPLSTQMLNMPPRTQKRAFTETHSQPHTGSIVHVAQHPQGVRYGFGALPQSRYDSIRGQTVVVNEEPESKRRRIEGQSSYPPRSPYQAFYPRRSIIHPQTPPQPVTVMAPPRSRYSQAQTLPHRPSVPAQPKKDLMLPPINTNGPPKPVIATSAQTQQSGIESIIMSQSVLSRLKTQSSITPALSSPKPGSPPYDVRGTIIAVEGLDRIKVAEMCNSLAEQLEREGKYAVRIFGGPDPYTTLDSSRRASIGGTGEHMTTAKYLDLISQWHKVSKEMVAYVTSKPGSVADVITDYEMEDARRISSVKDTKKNPFDRAASAPSDVEEEISPHTTSQAHLLKLPPPNDSHIPLAVQGISFPPPQQQPPQPPHPLYLGSTSPILSSTSSASPLSSTCSIKTSQQGGDAIPIALVPHYQLTTVDTCAIALPITDNYDPLTHWRWHATLWRGCVGPDITVVIDSGYEVYEEASESKASTAEQDATRITRSSCKTQSHAQHLPFRQGIHPAQQFQRPSVSTQAISVAAPPSAITPIVPQEPYSVEVRLQDHRAVIIKSNILATVHIWKDEQEAEAGKMKEEECWKAAKRRVGFEVEEFLRR